MFPYFPQEKVHEGVLRAYDPFCGNGILLATLQLRYPFRTLYGSDIRREAVWTTTDNLGIVSSSGTLDQRIGRMREEYTHSQKETLPSRIQYAQELREYVLSVYVQRPPAYYYIFTSDALNPTFPPYLQEPVSSIDLLLTDPPYGNDSALETPITSSPSEQIQQFLDSMVRFLSPDGRIGLMFTLDNQLYLKNFDVLEEVNLRKRRGYILVPS